MIHRVILEMRGDTPEIREAATDAVSLTESVADEPRHGVYLVTRTWQYGKVLDLDAHFDRLERSAEALGRPVQVPRRVIRQIVADNLPRRDGAVREGRFRVTAVLEGPLHYIISVEEAQPLPEHLRREGVVCQVAPGAARRDATVKSSAWMHERRQLSPRNPAAGGSEPYEYLLADAASRILEGATSNFYALLNGELFTAGTGVLEGTARRIVLEVAPSIVPVRLEPVTIDLLPNVTEAFITSATRGVVPVCRIGSADLGRPGPVTRKISAAYDRRLEALLEPLLPG